MSVEIFSLEEAPSSVSPAPRAARFSNLRTASQWAGAALFGGLIVMAGGRWALLAPLGWALVLYALYAASVSLLGVTLKEGRVTLPRCVWRLPNLVYGRRVVSIAGTGHVAALGTFMGAELVLLSTPDGEETALFSSRAQRLAFFEAMQTLNPAIEIYRAF